MSNESINFLPITFANAEACRNLTVIALASALSSKDQQFLADSMKIYGDMRVNEAQMNDAQTQKYIGLSISFNEAIRAADRFQAINAKLLEALKWIVNRNGECLGDHPKQLQIFKERIAKAEGIDPQVEKLAG